ncbi:EF-hand domain-containing protein D2-like [Diceros bicornis minor]|uniref:EF-hand domain-containing protein D2-like n=1 Tax=Diceros bicornis minor TaxID=77932 RepID=UPI0026F04CA1|nr:EF-hand domain-containing protein D2-like [Diceros bicornis minor]
MDRTTLLCSNWPTNSITNKIQLGGRGSIPPNNYVCYVTGWGRLQGLRLGLAVARDSGPFPYSLTPHTFLPAQFLLIFRKAAAGELQEDSGLHVLARLSEIHVSTEGVTGAKSFFEAKVQAISESSRFEEEIKAEQEERKKQAEEMKQRKAAFKELQATFK